MGDPYQPFANAIASQVVNAPLLNAAAAAASLGYKYGPAALRAAKNVAYGFAAPNNRYKYAFRGNSAWARGITRRSKLGRRRRYRRYTRRRRRRRY